MVKMILQKEKFLSDDHSTIILLDCCRFDLFEEVNWIEGELEKVKSLGSHTRESSKKFKELDTNRKVIATAGNVQCDIIDPTSFKNYNLPFYHPDVLIDGYRRFKNNYDKILIWFLQPHRPFIGEVKWLPEDYEDVNYSTESIGERKKELGIDFIRKGQGTNLEFILEKIEKNFEPPYVITSDHGDAWGENNKWDHAKGWDFPAVRHVPWFVKEE